MPQFQRAQFPTVPAALRPEQQVAPDGLRAEYHALPGQPLLGLPEGWCEGCASWRQRLPAGQPHAGDLAPHGCRYENAVVAPSQVRRLLPDTVPAPTA